MYCEEGLEYSTDLALINVGTRSSGPLRIKASAHDPKIFFSRDELNVESIGPGEKVEIKKGFPFRVTRDPGNNKDYFEDITGIILDVRENDSLRDIRKILIYPVPQTNFIPEDSDVLILDGAVKRILLYDNQAHKINLQTVSGGSGNGNFRAEPGETVILYIRLPQGLGPADVNTWHPAFLMNAMENQGISVPQLRYNIKGAEYSGAANLQSMIRIDILLRPAVK